MLSLMIAIVSGLVVVVAIILLVVVVVISRRSDFVNPFPSRKSDRQPVREVATTPPIDVQPHLYSQPVAHQEAALVDWLVAEASAQTGVNLIGDQMVHERIVNAVQKVIKELEQQDSAQISLPFLTADENGPKHFEIKITRQMSDQLR